MLGETRATVNDVRFPEYGREILRGASDGRSRGISSVLALPEVVLALSEVNDLHLARRHLKEIGRLEVAVTETHRLHVRERRDQRDYHLLELVLLPEGVSLLPLPENVLEVQLVVDVLTDYAYPEGVVHRLVEEIAEELNHIRMMLGFEQLHRFFLSKMMNHISVLPCIH